MHRVVELVESATPAFTYLLFSRNITCKITIAQMQVHADSRDTHTLIFLLWEGRITQYSTALLNEYLKTSHGLRVRSCHLCECQ